MLLVTVSTLSKMGGTCQAGILSSGELEKGNKAADRRRGRSLRVRHRVRWIQGFQFHQGGSPSPLVLSGRPVGDYFGYSLQQGMNRLPESSGSFPVDHPNLQDIPLAAGSEVVGEKVFYLTRLERVQIQDAIDGHFNGVRFIHDQNKREIKRQESKGKIMT